MSSGLPVLRSIPRRGGPVVPSARRRPGSGGFTLIELMIVTVLLGILAMIALPIYQGFRRDAAKGALEQQLRSLSQAERMYFFEYDVYTDDVDDLDYQPAGHVQLELRVAGAGGSGSPGGPSGSGPPGSGPPGGGPPWGGPPPWAGPPGGAGGSPVTGWSARLTDPTYEVRCAVFYGTVEPFEPATVEGEIACDEEG